MSHQRIEADERGAYTSGVKLSGHNSFVQATFRTAFATYKHLVKPGESLSGRQWADRVAACRDEPVTVSDIAYKIILRVMGDE